MILLPSGDKFGMQIYSTPAFEQRSDTLSSYVDKKRVRERAGSREDARGHAKAAITRLSTGKA